MRRDGSIDELHTLHDLSNSHEVVWLLPCYAQALERRKTWARKHSPLMFGVKATTFDTFISDLWDLYGDGKRIVSSVERQVILAGLFAQGDENDAEGRILKTPGTLRLISKIIARGSGLAEFEEAKKQSLSEEDVSFAGVERILLRIARDYDACLDQDYAIEEGSVLALLPKHLPPKYCTYLICEGCDPLDVPQQRFFEALSAATQADIMLLDGDLDQAEMQNSATAKELLELRKSIFFRQDQAQIEPSGAVRFLLPTGSYAKPRLLADTLEQLGAALPSKGTQTASVIVVCKDPSQTYELLVRRLVSRGITCAVQGRKAFSETAFGRAFLALAHFFHDEEFSSLQLTDFLQSPFSGLSLDAARKIDARLRKNRSISLNREAMWRIFQQASDQCSFMAELAESGDALQIKSEFDAALAKRRDWSDAYRAEQSKAFSVLCELGNEAERFGVPFSLLIGLLESSWISLSMAVDEDAQVLFCDERTAATLPPASCQALIYCDMNATDYPVRESVDAETTFFSKIGVAAPAQALQDARERFSQILALPLNVFICERTLNDAKADACYPSVMFQEVIDCYRADITADDLDDVFGLPPSLLGYVSTQGEDGLQDCVSLDGESLNAGTSVSLEKTGAIAKQENREHVILLRHPHGRYKDMPVLSPTSLERYLECPYRWFVEKRLRTDTLDAGFGPMEKGQLVHEVMRRFYQEWQAGNATRRVDPENVEQALLLAADVFDRCYATQLGSDEDAYLVVGGPLEEQQIRALRKKILEFVESEATFLKGFAPRYLEHQFGSKSDDEQVFSYAGCSLRGFIDRIDRDDQGRAVVIDYKYSAGEAYKLLPKETVVEGGFSLPQKVQALMYAQVARKSLGLDVIGALYVGYGKGDAMGAFDDGVLDPQDLRMRSAQRGSCGIRATWGISDFGQLLDMTEEKIRVAVNTLSQGDIMPSPLKEEICTWCAAVTCDARRS